MLEDKNRANRRDGQGGNAKVKAPGEKLDDVPVLPERWVGECNDLELECMQLAWSAKSHVLGSPEAADGQGEARALYGNHDESPGHLRDIGLVEFRVEWVGDMEYAVDVELGTAA